MNENVYYNIGTEWGQRMLDNKYLYNTVTRRVERVQEVS